MIERAISPDIKAIIIEVADIFYNLPEGKESLEDCSQEEEKEAHILTVSNVIEKAKEEGYKKYVWLNRREAKERGQDLGLNGVYLLIFSK